MTMTAMRMSRLIRGVAGPTLLLRVGVVGVNFLVMLGLAWWLGLSEFGDLMVHWGMAMVASTVLSLGAPLLILRVMADGSGVQVSGLLRLVVVFPVLLSVVAAGILPSVAPDVEWGAVILTGLAVNALSCLASVMRALGSVQLSMALRDGVPQVALGLAGCLGAGASGVLFVASGIMAVVALAVLRRCRADPALRCCLRSDGDAGQIRIGLWANTVLGMVTAQVDIILGGTFLSADQIGLYALVRRIANLVALPVSVATWVSAGPISAAHGAGDRAALRAASAVASRVAVVPGGGLFLAAMLILPFWPMPEGAMLLVAVLLVGAFVQVVLASGYTVATLCGLERFALGARLISLGLYLVCVSGTGLATSATGNALAYLAGITGGGALLWWVLWQRLQIDTSAMALCPQSWGRRWRLP
ncbi:lipopolysaccharide biosynthesis protein [Yoonia sp.]|uniref:lipopolysaccharide biosynthesis protein n=1 Tax=Yoonia sp. TaxID=2212373 RepID=UPI003F6D4F62